jgi:hypothetical protein
MGDIRSLFSADFAELRQREVRRINLLRRCMNKVLEVFLRCTDDTPRIHRGFIASFYYAFLGRESKEGESFYTNNRG